MICERIRNKIILSASTEEEAERIANILRGIFREVSPVEPGKFVFIKSKSSRKFRDDFGKKSKLSNPRFDKERQKFFDDFEKFLFWGLNPELSYNGKFWVGNCLGREIKFSPETLGNCFIHLDEAKIYINSEDFFKIFGVEKEKYIKEKNGRE